MDDSFVESVSHSDSEEFSDDIDTEFYRAVDCEDALEYQNPEFIVSSTILFCVNTLLLTADYGLISFV